MHVLKRDMVCEFRDFLLMEERSRATIDKYIRDISCFYRFADGKGEVTKGLVIEYKYYLEQQYKPASVNSMIVALNCFFRYLKWNDCRVRGIKIQRRIFSSEEKELTKGEYTKLLAAAERRKDTRMYYILQTICATGIRVSELRYITIEGIRTGKIEVSCKGKMRKVFVPSKLRKELLDYTKKEGRKKGPVFITRNGNVVNRSNIWTQMKRLCEEANVAKEKVFPHNLRHLFASTFYELKKDLVKLADILGHSNIETTRIYTMTTGKEHERQISSLGLLAT